MPANGEKASSAKMRALTKLVFFGVKEILGLGETKASLAVDLPFLPFSFVLLEVSLTDSLGASSHLKKNGVFFISNGLCLI